MSDWKEQKAKAGDDALSKDFPDYEVVEHRIGNQTNAEENNNKFFSLELHKSSTGKWRVYSNYGRVSSDEYTGAVGIYGPSDETDMRAFFESKFKSKVRPSKGYKEIEFVTAKVGSPKARQKKNKISDEFIPETKKQKLVENTTLPKIDLHPDIARLIEQWYKETSSTIKNNSAVEITSDGLTTPLGVLSFKQLSIGRDILKEINDSLTNKDKIRKLTGDFYSNIPAKLGRKISDDDLISTKEIIEQKQTLIDLMEDALEVGGASFTSPTIQKFIDLGISIDFIPKADQEWARVQKNIINTKGHNHYSTTTKVKHVFKIKLKDQSTFNSCRIVNQQELYHGTRNCNITGILKSGMKIAPPGTPTNGSMFDVGSYFGSQSTKSINYSLYPFPGMGNPKNCFLFLFQVKLGKQMELYDACYNARTLCKQKGYDSVWGKKGRSLIHDEYIVYDTAQTMATHIIELER